MNYGIQKRSIWTQTTELYLSHLGMYRIKYTKLTLSCTLVKHSLYVSVLTWVPAYIKQNQESGNNFFPSLYLLVSVHLGGLKPFLYSSETNVF